MGKLEAGADTFAGQIPLILKANSANSLIPSVSPKDQAVTASVDEALRLGCSAVGFTIYPGSSACLEMLEEAAALAEEAKARGLAVVVWSYPRGESLEKSGETAIDVCAYAAQMAALLGAHVIKVKLPDAHIAGAAERSVYETEEIDVSSPAARVRHVMQAAFAGRRIVVFSGGAKRASSSVFDDARAIRDGGGNGSIIGRNTFQRPRDEAIGMLDRLIRIYRGEE